MSDILCVYYSRTGRTEKAMKEIAQALDAELVKIEELEASPRTMLPFGRGAGENRGRTGPQQAAGLLAFRPGGHEQEALPH